MSMDTFASTTAPGQQPDMTRPDLVRLSVSAHRGLCFRPAPDYAFASRATMTGIVAAELTQAALNYPLAFLPHEDELELVGLLSTQEGRNLFVSTNGAWLTDFVPASVGTYPFRYRQGARGGHPSLYADMASGLLVPDGEGAALFGADGTPSAKLREIVAALKAYEKSRRLTRKVCGQLRQAGLLVPWGADCEAASMRALLRVDESRLRKLSIVELDALRQSGGLLLAYAHLISLAGLPRLARLAHVHATAEHQRRQLLQSCFRLDESIEDTFRL